MAGVKRVKVRIDTGGVCEPYVYQVPGAVPGVGLPRFREECRCGQSGGGMSLVAADMIEELMAENARLREARDAEG